MKRFVLFWSIMICLGLSMNISNAYAKNNEAVKVSDSTELKESEKEELRKVFREEMHKEEQAKEKQKKEAKGCVTARMSRTENFVDVLPQKMGKSFRLMAIAMG